MKKVYTCFCTDIIHEGHLNIINEAKKYGEVIVGVLSDEAMVKFNRFPTLDFKERVDLVRSIAGVSKVIIQNEVMYNDVIDEIKPDYVIHGTNWLESPMLAIRQNVEKLLSVYGGEIIDVPYMYNDDIALVHTTHNETGTGILNPIRDIGALIHKYNAVFTVDTTSTLAMRPINIEKDNIDFCMASAQKGLMAMTGLSFIIGNKEIIEKSKDYPRRSYYCNLYLQYHFFETTGQMHFTPPVQTVYAAVQAMKEYFEEGEQNKWERHLRVSEAIHDGLSKLGFKEVIKREWQSGLVVTAIYPDDENWNFEKIHDY